ncbi:unnamed protein product [Durusdinium trenchii]|uniref:Acid phosphatase n=1 Tax=Durusdinium trenchii TaxID=1381693 RepID=A0ABP0RA63_9DINO
MAVSFMCLSGLVEETATNWTLGAFPTCKALHQEEVIKGDAKQVLFNDGSNQELCGFQSSKVIQSFLGGGKYEALLNAWKSQIQLVDSVVHCCSSELCPGHLPCNLSSLPIKYTGKFWAATEGAFDIAVFWAEFFLLEYLNGNPQYAQGQLGVSDLVDLYRMAVENIEIMDDHFASRSFESTMASHILGTLLQAAERKPIPGLSHSQNTKVVYMAGHDTNLILLRLLLGLRWQSHGWAQNGVAPGGMLIFELEQRQEGGPVVSIYFQVAQPAQLREGQPFSEPQAPSRVQAMTKPKRTTYYRRCFQKDGYLQVAAGVYWNSSPPRFGGEPWSWLRSVACSILVDLSSHRTCCLSAWSGDLMVHKEAKVLITVLRIQLPRAYKLKTRLKTRDRWDADFQ